MSVTSRKVLRKSPWEEADLRFDFARQLPAGVTVASVLAVDAVSYTGGASDLGFGAPAIEVGNLSVKVRISGGTLGDEHLVRFRIATTNNNEIERCGILRVVYVESRNRLLIDADDLVDVHYDFGSLLAHYPGAKIATVVAPMAALLDDGSIASGIQISDGVLNEAQTIVQSSVSGAALDTRYRVRFRVNLSDGQKRERFGVLRSAVLCLGAA